MNQILSQNEVDALLAAVSEGAIDDEPETPAASSSARRRDGRSVDVRPYDLTSQERILRGNMPMLDVIHEKFCRDFSGTLSLEVGHLSELVAEKIRLMKYQEFINSLPVPSCLSLFKIEPLPGNGVVVVDSQFVFTLVDIFCGGSGSSRFRVEGRDFSSIELGILRRIVRKALADLEKAWAPVFPTQIEFLRTEINPQFVSIAHPTEAVISLESKVDVEGAFGRFQTVLPYATIEPIKDLLTKNYVGEKSDLDKLWKNEVRGHIMESAVELRAIMGTAELSIGRILGLKEGEILSLEQFADEPIDLMVEGVNKFKVESGVFRGYKALQVVGKTD